jgi:HTH-type transcriptional regulator / antitoxin MqsA
MPHIALMEMNMKDLNSGAEKALCPICGEGQATPGSEMVLHEYHGQSKMLPLYFTTCDVCTSESAGLEESRANKRAVMAFRKAVDGLLTGDEICALRSKYKLTQLQAAELFGGGPVAFSKYENDDVAHSEAMDTLLRLVRRSESAFLELLAEKGMTKLLGAIKPGFKSVAVTTVFSAQPKNVIEMAGYKLKKMSLATAVSSTYIGGQEEKLWK